MGKVLDLRKKLDFYTRPTHGGEQVLPKVRDAAGSLYFLPTLADGDKITRAPGDWSTLIQYGHVKFDPHYVGMEECTLDDTFYDSVFTKRTEEEGEKASIEIFDFIKERMLKRNWHLLQKGMSGFPQNHIRTKEDITKNSAIIGFYYLKDGVYERYFVKNVSKVLKYREHPEKLKKYIFDASSMPIQNKTILSMLDYFKNNKSNVVALAR